MSERNPVIAPWPVGARGGLIDEKHRKAMGEAVFLFMWCLLRQTGQKDGWGVVLYGKPVTYDFIFSETGFALRTLQRWMATLISEKYLRVLYDRRGMVIHVAKAKKWWGNTTKTLGGKTVKEEAYHKKSLARCGDPASPDVATLNTKSGDPKPTQASENQSVKVAPNSKSVELLNSTKIRHDAGASGVVNFSDLIAKTELPKREELSARQLDERRRQLERQKDELRRKGLLTA